MIPLSVPVTRSDPDIVDVEDCQPALSDVEPW